jgi:hypothetical protein
MNMELIKWISLIGYLVIGMTFAPVRTRPSRTVELSDIEIPARKAAKVGCYNAYYPVSATLKKVYIDPGPLSVQPKRLEFFGNITDEGFIIKTTAIIKEKPDLSDWADEKVMIESDYQCKPEGLVRTEFANRVRNSLSTLKRKTLKMGGVSYPNESEWKVGKKWQIWFLVEAQSMKITPAKVVSRDTYTSQYEIIGREAITVPAGTFEAFKVAVIESIRIHVNTTGFKLPVSDSTKYVHWYAKDIGLVKILRERDAIVVTQLISVER